MESTKFWESKTLMGGLILVALVVALVLGGRALGVGDEMIRAAMEWISGIGIAVLGLNKAGKIGGKVSDALTARRVEAEVARAESEGGTHE